MIRLLVDSAADCRPAPDQGRYLVPITVTVGGQDYADGVDLTADQFYPLLSSSEQFPKTAQPSPQDFLEIYEQAKEAGDQVIYLAMSSALSGTYQSALIAKDMADYEGIHVVDTRLVTHGIGLLAQRAMDLRDSGADAATVVTEIEQLKSRIKILVAVDTLEFLYRGGRLSRTAATIGGMAGLKPLVTVNEEGQVAMAGKCLGRIKAATALQKALDNAILDPAYPIHTLYTYGEDNVTFLEQKLKAYPLAGRWQVGSTIGAHVGPGVFGIIYVVK